MWLKYALLAGERTVILVNTIGASLFLCYTIIYYIFTVNKTTTIRQFLIVLLILMSSIFYTKYTPNYDEATRVMGITCCVIGVIFFASPLIMLAHVVRTKNSYSLPFPIISSSFVVAFLWLIYGILIDDKYIQVCK